MRLYLNIFRYAVFQALPGGSAMSHKIENARENLLSAGRRALLSEGYGGLNIKALSAQCGMAAGTFYQYFHGKDDLVMQIVFEDFAAIPASIRGVSRSSLPLRGKFEYIYNQFLAYQRTYLSMKIGVLRFTDDYAERRAGVMKQINGAVEELLDYETERGDLELHADHAAAAYLLTHFLFSAARDAGLGFEVIWSCMNFRDLNSPVSQPEA